MLTSVANSTYFVKRLLLLLSHVLILVNWAACASPRLLGGRARPGAQALLSAPGHRGEDACAEECLCERGRPCVLLMRQPWEQGRERQRRRVWLLSVAGQGDGA